jgi:hypothetical protein
MVLSSENYTRSTALAAVSNFLSGALPREAFRDWVDAFDWDIGAEPADPVLRTAIGALELIFHEFDDGLIGPEQVRERIAGVRQLLSQPHAAIPRSA